MPIETSQSDITNSASYRRRRLGARPIYGTGWMTSNIRPSQGYNRPPPPPPPGQQSYEYGYVQGPQQGSGVYGAPQEPAAAYTGDKDQYAPPSGPPPSRALVREGEAERRFGLW